MILSGHWKWLGVLFLGCALVFTLTPFGFTLLNSLKYQIDLVTGEFPFTPTADNYQSLLFSPDSNFAHNATNSLVVAVATAILVVAVSALAGYSLQRFRWPRIFTALIAGWILLFHMIPGVTMVGPFYLLFRGIGLYDTQLTLILTYLVLNLPMAIWIVQSFVADLPVELEEAARIDGASNLRTFLQVVTPLIAPGLAAVAILTFVFSWNEFIFALNLTTNKAATIPVGIAKYAQDYQVHYGEMSAAAFLATMPAIAFLIVAQRHIVKGLTLGALK
jgi:multiple sugar transport system permease protein